MQPEPSNDRSAPTREGAPTMGRGALRLERRADGKLWLETGAGSVAIEIVRCFPWSAAERFLSLRDAAGLEVGFIDEPKELDPASLAAVRATLGRASFVLEVTRILAVDEDFELRSFRVETPHGPRAFQTPLDAWPRELEGGGLVLEDVHGDLYRVSRPLELDRASRKLLWAFVD
jgi:hypothetical protein